MYLTQAEENKNKAIALSISVGVMTLLILLLIFYFTIVTPNPPFAESGGKSGIEFNIGNFIEGTGNVDANGMGEAPKVIESTEVVKPENSSATSPEEVVTSEVGEDVNIKKSDTKNNTQNSTVVVAVKPKEKTAAELLKEKFLKNQGKNAGGDGNSGHAGDDGRPDGNPNTNGHGGTGGVDDGGDGGDGGKTGPNKGKYGFDLKGRSILTPPPLSKDTKEEGKVVVEIVVDKQGNVIKAEAVGRGTNTNSIMLKTKARQAALATKFNVGSEFEEQKGTITIIFSF